jgi:methyltransferase
VTLSVAVLAFVTVQRLGELILANRNTRRLLDRGAVESGAGHYPLIVALHAAWLAGLWWLAWDRHVDSILLGLFIALQLVRVWVIATLGERWTTRIITLPDAGLVRRGPYRFVSHPNYAVVAAEIAVLPLAFGLVGFAAVFSVLNAAVLWIRICSEGRALALAPGEAASGSGGPEDSRARTGA